MADATERRRIGILTSGGDCPGLNAVIRAAAIRATFHYKLDVIGIQYGTHGLAQRKFVNLNTSTLNCSGTDPLLNQGGTILKSINKPIVGDTEEAILSGYKELALDGIIAIGGDGSLKIIHDIAVKGDWKLVGVPKTIDNDVALTERSVGFETAIETVTDALSKLSDTASSHDRIMVVEVMGRTVGHLALHSGVAGGVDVILLPEFDYSVEKVWRKIQMIKTLTGRRFSIVVVAEGCKIPEGSKFRSFGDHIAAQLKAVSIANSEDVEIRVMVLGHIQRGGQPCASDKTLASSFGVTAVDLLMNQQFNTMVSVQGTKILPQPISEVTRIGTVGVSPDHYLVKTARGLGIYVGEIPRTPSS